MFLFLVNGEKILRGPGESEKKTFSPCVWRGENVGWPGETSGGPVKTSGGAVKTPGGAVKKNLFHPGERFHP